MSGDHNMYQKTKSYLNDDFECPRCGHCCQALETEQEPVAHIDHRIHGWPDCFVIRADPPHTSPLYLSLPKREWVGLTDEEVSYFEYQATFCDELDTSLMAELIEQALKKKNNGKYRNRTTTERTKLKEKNQ